MGQVGREGEAKIAGSRGKRSVGRERSGEVRLEEARVNLVGEDGGVGEVQRTDCDGDGAVEDDGGGVRVAEDVGLGEIRLETEGVSDCFGGGRLRANDAELALLPRPSAPPMSTIWETFSSSRSGKTETKRAMLVKAPTPTRVSFSPGARALQASAMPIIALPLSASACF
jgi:hypothetical protein